VTQTSQKSVLLQVSQLLPLQVTQLSPLVVGTSPLEQVTQTLSNEQLAQLLMAHSMHWRSEVRLKLVLQTEQLPSSTQRAQLDTAQAVAHSLVSFSRV
jgi:hypothetical protein